MDLTEGFWRVFPERKSDLNEDRINGNPLDLLESVPGVALVWGYRAESSKTWHIIPPVIVES